MINKNRIEEWQNVTFICNKKYCTKHRKEIVNDLFNLYKKIQHSFYTLHGNV